MKNFTLFLFLIFFGAGSLFAQYDNVFFDANKSYFNDGQPLPSGKDFYIMGNVQPETRLVKLNIYKKNDLRNGSPVYSSQWKLTGQERENFSIPVRYKLKGHSEYDLEFVHYAELTEARKKELLSRIMANLDACVDAGIDVRKKKLSLRSSHKKILAQLNQLSIAALEDYMPRDGKAFPGFSESVNFRLQYIDDVKIERSDIDGMEENDLSRQEARKRLLDEELQELRSLLRQELEDYMSGVFYQRSFQYAAENYPTEKGASALNLHAGYGMTVLEANKTSFGYSAAPYAGLSFPLANRQTGPRFLSNTSIITGVSFTQAEAGGGSTVEGPVGGMSIYLGAGYKVFQFIRLNAGGMLMDVQNDQGTFDSKIKPFVGLSAEFGLSLHANRN